MLRPGRSASVFKATGAVTVTPLKFSKFKCLRRSYDFQNKQKLATILKIYIYIYSKEYKEYKMENCKIIVPLYQDQFQ